MSIWLNNLIRKRRMSKIKDRVIDMANKKLADTMQEEYDKQQERKRKMYISGQMALEELRHKENGPHFSDILKEMQELYEKKNHDYGNSFSETIQEFGFSPAIARINDKLKRVKQMVKGEQMLVNESMRDNLIDIANYCILTIIELDKIK